MRPSESGANLCGHISATHEYSGASSLAPLFLFFQNTKGVPNKVNAYGASSSKSHSNAIGYHCECQSKGSVPLVSKEGRDSSTSKTAPLVFVFRALFMLLLFIFIIVTKEELEEEDEDNEMCPLCC